MDLGPKAQVLTAHDTPLTKLVVIRAKASIMGILKSPLLLSFCKSGLDLKDEMLESLVKFLSYVDNILLGLLAAEIQQLQQQTNFSKSLQPQPCGYELCCPPSDDHNLLEPALAPAVLADETWATRNLLRGDFGHKLMHLFVYRAGK